MKKFLTLVLKECKHIIRDTRTMMILFGIPIVQITLFGFALTTEVNDVKLAVYTPEESNEAQHLIQLFDATSLFSVEQQITSPDKAQELFRQHQIDAALIFPPNFAEQLTKGSTDIQLLVDGSDPNTARTISLYTQRVVESFRTVPSPLKVQTRLLYNPQARSAFNFVPGIMGLVLMLICAMMTAISIVREKEMGSMDVLLISPTPPLYIVGSKILPYFILSCLNIGIILLLSVFLLQVPIQGSLATLLLLCGLYVGVALLFGFLISNIAQSQVVAMLASGMLLMMPTMLLSGMLYPIDSMPIVLQWFSCIIPARWFITATRKVMIEGASILFVWREIVILLTMLVALLLVSLKTFKVRSA